MVFAFECGTKKALARRAGGRGRVDEGESEERQGDRGRRKRAPRPLGPDTLGELALAYVARFATSRAKLARYLQRKLKERGWEGERPADIEALVERLTGLGFIDDRAFAEAKAGSLLRRGYGRRRVGVALIEAGIAEEDRGEALEEADRQALTAALRFAERKRIGPYARSATDREEQSKALAAMVRAGHGFDLARRIVAALPGTDFKGEED
jgi:regulatory protein